MWASFRKENPKHKICRYLRCNACNTPLKGPLRTVIVNLSAPSNFLMISLYQKARRNEKFYNFRNDKATHLKCVVGSFGFPRAKLIRLLFFQMFKVADETVLSLCTTRNLLILSLKDRTLSLRSHMRILPKELVG